MSVYEIAAKRRTIRKFKQDKLENELLLSFIDAARLAPSASNMQPIKYKVINNAESVNKLFPSLKWAGYIAPNGNPAAGEEPTAYIVILVDTKIRNSGYELDIGAAAQTIMLCAQEKGIGTCWLGAIDRDAIRKDFNIGDEYTINTVIALGYPLEEPQTEVENGSIKYYKDENGKLHVPKRKLEDILV